MSDRIKYAFDEILADNALMERTMSCIEAKKRRCSDGLPVLRIASASAAVLISGIFLFNILFVAAAHVSFDINPSVELSLNRLGRVIAVYAQNQDGSQVLRNIDLRGKKVEEAAVEVLSAVEREGYITDEALISVAVYAGNGTGEQTMCDTILSFLDNKLLAIQSSAEVEVFAVTEETWQNAHSHHMSPSKYLAIQELLEADTSAVLEDYEGSTISQIRQRTQECRSGHNEESGHSGSQGHGHGYRGGR